MKFTVVLFVILVVTGYFSVESHKGKGGGGKVVIVNTQYVGGKGGWGGQGMF
jgi:hypothetical protein